ncbi:MAG TPA: KUP/HAK/KT family potassium transporter, partial [Planctomycetota bacterium]|nr:KUP/HAK/KT family potassium transporter [Planctomycetota bacterium]
MRPKPPSRAAALALAFAALGVVYGDIGTSPLYALKECFHPHGASDVRILDPRSPDHVLGVLSLVIWSLVVVVCIKYLTLLLRIDN